MGRFELHWDPFDQTDPYPCINIIIMNSRDVIEAGRAIGLEYPGPRPIRALLDTGASFTVINKVLASSYKLFSTNEDFEITSLGATLHCGEHAAAISFPGTDLQPFDPIRVLSAVFVKERSYACLIGRDILRNWVIEFDGRSKRVTITD